jgi:hypothetical protein
MSTNPWEGVGQEHELKTKQLATRKTAKVKISQRSTQRHASITQSHPCQGTTILHPRMMIDLL